jgi:hypothetical protein
MRPAMAKQKSCGSFERWRVELFFKKPSELESVTSLLRRCVKRVNVTNKVRRLLLVASAVAIAHDQHCCCSALHAASQAWLQLSAYVVGSWGAPTRGFSAVFQQRFLNKWRVFAEQGGRASAVGATSSEADTGSGCVLSLEHQAALQARSGRNASAADRAPSSLRT